ncbi:MAG: AAA family ATPase [Akkermansiaceae bacterium]|nr:AAA family ATPase [Akkermansiaceae bacterium]
MDGESKFSNIPSELTKLQQWVCFDLDHTGKKIPYIPGTDSMASSNRSRDWRSFRAACADVESGKRQHVGFCFTKDDPYVFIDLDDPEDDDQVKVFKRFDTYAQRSVSGEGCHIICRGTFQGAGKHPKFPHAGLFKQDRFCLMTGDVVTGREEIKEVPTEDLQAIHTWLGGRPGESESVSADLVEYQSEIPDMTVFEMGCDTFRKFAALSAGRWEQFEEYHNDHSTADHAFIAMLCDLTESNEQVRYLFKISGMWNQERADKKAGHGPDGYINRTIRKVRAEQERVRNRMAKYTLAFGTGDETRSMIVRGVNHFPTASPPESILLGNGWLRIGDIATLISTAGAGKSVAVSQAAMMWGIGLPYLGISPARPLRILLFTGEDDDVTLGQCREGLLENSEAITGRTLTAKKLERLDTNLRTVFVREHVGDRFHPYLESLLVEEAADLVIVNPMLSYVGGEIVSCASSWLRAGLMPILQRHNCGSLIAHHTPKLAKDGWENTDDTYSAIGGAEMANIPRAILTLRPTPASGVSVVRVSKRQTTGWKDDSGDSTTAFYVKRSCNPERPAWIPIGHREAMEAIVSGKASYSTRGKDRKVTSEDVANLLTDGPVWRNPLIAQVRASFRCSDKTAKDAINRAAEEERIVSYTKKNPKGGHPMRYFKLPGAQGVGELPFATP